MKSPRLAGFDGRLMVAALICVVSLGLGWEASRSSTGYLTPGLIMATNRISPITGDLVMDSQFIPGSWVEGNPMRTRRGFQSDVRVVLVPAAVILALMARDAVKGERSLRLARVAIVALAVIAVRALMRGQLAPALAMAAVLLLAAPAIGPPWLSERARRLLPG